MYTSLKNLSTRSVALCTALIILLSLFNACKQDHAELEPAAAESSRQSFTELAAQNPAAFVELLKDFSAQAKTIRENSVADQQRYSDTPVEDVLPLLEGTAHLDYLVRKNALSGFSKKDMVFTVEKVSSGMLSGAGVQNAYNQLYAAIQNELSQESGRILFLVDATIKENREESTEIAATILTAVNGSESPILQFICGVQPDDYWHPGGDLGKCDGTQLPKDAADREMEIMNPSICWPVCDGQSTTLWLTSVGLPFGYNDSPLGKLIWPMGAGGPNLYCLSPAQMQTNMDILHDIKNIYHPPAPYHFAGAWIRSTEFISNGDLFYTYHDGIMYYVVQFCVSGGGNEQP